MDKLASLKKEIKFTATNNDTFYVPNKIIYLKINLFLQIK